MEESSYDISFRPKPKIFKSRHRVISSSFTLSSRVKIKNRTNTADKINADCEHLYFGTKSFQFEPSGTTSSVRRTLIVETTCDQ